MKLIALDLDGTLLNSEKVISAGNFAALSLAAEQGHVIVPATGRALRAIPEQVMALPFLRYAIRSTARRFPTRGRGRRSCVLSLRWIPACA